MEDFYYKIQTSQPLHIPNPFMPPPPIETTYNPAPQIRQHFSRDLLSVPIPALCRDLWVNHLTGETYHNVGGTKWAKINDPLDFKIYAGVSREMTGQGANFWVR